MAETKEIFLYQRGTDRRIVENNQDLYEECVYDMVYVSRDSIIGPPLVFYRRAHGKLWGSKNRKTEGGWIDERLGPSPWIKTEDSTYIAMACHVIYGDGGGNSIGEEEYSHPARVIVNTERLEKLVNADLEDPKTQEGWSKLVDEIRHPDAEHVSGRIRVA